MKKSLDDDVVIHSTLESGEDLFIKDQRKKEYHFKLSIFEWSSGLIAEAIEVKKDILQGYHFNMLFDFDTDPEIAKEQFMKKIKRGINRRHLTKQGGKWRIGKKGILRGEILWNDDFEDTAYDRVFIIDGKRITMENFNTMFEAWEGWHFEFEILDPSDERT
jgi:hypothetical protein